MSNVPPWYDSVCTGLFLGKSSSSHKCGFLIPASLDLLSSTVHLLLPWVDSQSTPLLHAKPSRENEDSSPTQPSPHSINDTKT